MEFTGLSDLGKPAWYQVKNLNKLDAALSQTTTPGGLRVDDIFQPDILDAQRRRNIIGQRLNQKTATGSPSRWIEKDALPGGQAFVDPQLLTGQTPGRPNRSPHYLELKALMGEYDSTMFNREITDQQGIFSGQDEEDFNDTLAGLLKKHDRSIWQGAASSISVAPNAGVPASLDYCGFFQQLAAASNAYTTSVSAGASIVKAVTSIVAQIAAQDNEIFLPTAIYLAPLAYEFLCEEMEKKTLYFGDDMSPVPGKTVKTINTVVGPLPLIPDFFMGDCQISVPSDAWPIAIVLEDFLEYHFLTTQDVRIFELGLVAGLARKRVMVKFGAFGVKKAANAHGFIKVAKNYTAP